MLNFRQHPLWQTAKRFAFDPGRRALVDLECRRKVPLTWCLGSNWGDALSPVLVTLLSNKPTLHVDGLHHNRYLAIGSILGSANERAEIWGSGFIRDNEPVVGLPRAVHAVRGPLTRDALLDQGIECPEIYGDPALLLPRFYDPAVRKHYNVGIIPHYIDKDHFWLEQYRDDPDVRVIDIESGIQDFVRAVKSCRVILSSSLHGLICSDAYGIPRAWITLSDEVVGGGFKFRDYQLSIGAGNPTQMRVRENTSLAQAAKETTLHPLQIDLRRLLLACPFLCAELREEVQHSPDASCGLPESFVSRRLRDENARE